MARAIEDTPAKFTASLYMPRGLYYYIIIGYNIRLSQYSIDFTYDRDGNVSVAVIFAASVILISPRY